MSRERDEVWLEPCGAEWTHVEVVELRGREAISASFVFEVDVVVLAHGTFDPDEALGLEVEIVILSGGDERRRIHGMVTSVVDRLLARTGHREYALEVRPRFERLSLVETQEIFVGSSVPEIIEQKLTLAGFAKDVDFRFALGSNYSPREFVVQYRESDLAFIGRLTEHLGISYYFEYVPGKTHGHERLVFTDHTAEFPAKPTGAKTCFRPRGERLDVYLLESRRSITPSLWAVQDYNYRFPTLDIVAMKEDGDGHGGGVVEYSPNAKTPEEAAALAQVRVEERAALCRYHHGESHRGDFAAGATFDLVDHPSVADETKFLLVEVTHSVRLAVSIAGGEPADYRNTFRAVLASTSYRPPRRTRRPRIHGIVTAIVSPLATASPGALADLDDQGRYRLRFLFDTSSSDARNVPSHPIRQIQHHAGPNYGTHFPLKPGTEVQVAFLDGDPDRPMIVGAVPNPVTPSPVDGEDPTKHRIRSAAGVLIEFGERPRSTRSDATARTPAPAAKR